MGEMPPASTLRGDGVTTISVMEYLFPGVLRHGSTTAGFPAVFAIAAARAVADLVAYTEYSTVNELLVGDFPGTSQFQHASSSKTMSRDTCTRLEDWSYMRYAFDPS
jgi:hypothetical protein